MGDHREGRGNFRMRKIYRKASIENQAKAKVSYSTISGDNLTGLSTSELKVLLAERSLNIVKSPGLHVDQCHVLQVVAVLNALSARQMGRTGYFQCPIT